jgi:ABC-type Na+ transport system ATPase subunit NatA
MASDGVRWSLMTSDGVRLRPMTSDGVRLRPIASDGFASSRAQLVMLDEPSSGMDAASKRFLWSVIKRRTKGCMTVLTTHSMEECEALCGRIGIMVDGTLSCLGPIQALKSKYVPCHRPAADGR